MKLYFILTIFFLFVDDQQSSGRPELGDRASRANNDADGEGITVTGTDLIRRSADGPTPSGSRRSAESHEAEIHVLGRHGIFLVARQRLALDRRRKQRSAGATVGGNRA